jgi:2-keto-4-pentenoate hydratase/2-oxohepta-3-ene-1,7-dioic acid hydratase in catechol pathway
MKLLLPRNYKPGKIVCVGRNYAEHAAELGNDVPAEPLLFLKAPTAVCFDGDAIRIPSQSHRVEHEAELGLIISRRCKDIADDEDALQFVHGFLCLNDVTARDLQRRDGQFARAKSFDTFCPIGPEVVSGIDPSNLNVICRVNGEIRQSGNTRQMLFPVEFLLRYISRQMTLEPGDLIATGTPAGVSQLNPGDVCTVEIEGIGTLTNPVQ